MCRLHCIRKQVFSLHISTVLTKTKVPVLANEISHIWTTILKATEKTISAFGKLVALYVYFNYCYFTYSFFIMLVIFSKTLWANCKIKKVLYLD